MADQPFTSPVEDSVPKSGDLAIGENLDFQRKWWRFEGFVWSFFLLLLMCDLSGVFGRGWFAKATLNDPGRLSLDFERVERAGTPSIMTFHFNDAAIRNGQVRLFVSDDVIKPLGAQRISPQPAASVMGAGGITYTFPVTAPPATAEIELEPSFPGLHTFRVEVSGGPPLQGKVLVVP